MPQTNSASTQPNILELLDNAPFPLTIIEMVEFAQNHGASEEALDIIQAMPDMVYKGIHEVSKHINEIEELPNNDDMWGSEPSQDLIQENKTSLPDGTNYIIRK